MDQSNRLNYRPRREEHPYLPVRPVAAVALFDERLARGQYFALDVDRHQLLTAFRKLSAQTPRSGCKTMDIMHVACALQVEPLHFVSFDAHLRVDAAEAADRDGGTVVEVTFTL